LDENMPLFSNINSSTLGVSTLDNPSSFTTQSSSPLHFPIIRSVDKPSSSLPKNISMTEDYLCACVGFRRVDTIRKHFKTLYKDTVTFDSMPADAVLDSGCLATIRKKNRNTTPVPRPMNFGDVFHLDTIFGPEILVGNAHYGLICVDRYSRMTYIYPLKNLTTDIQKQLESFFSHLGLLPRRIITDFDLKLIGGKAREYLNSMLIHVNAAPSHRQDKNGLAERHWQSLVSMARNWLASAELPPSFWFYAVRRAAEVCNYFPFKLEDNSVSTPFEPSHLTKPDLRNLFKPFCLAAVCRERIGDDVLPKFESQSIPMITLGKCPQSVGLQFFNPENAIVTSIDYSFQPSVTSGARFGYRYQSGTFIYQLDETTTMFAPTFPLESQVLVHSHTPPHSATVIGTPSYLHPDIYTVKFKDNSIAEYSISDYMLEAVSKPSHISQQSLLPSWVQEGSTATLFLHNMSKPRHGRLYLND